MLDLSLPLGLRDLTPDHSAHLADLSSRLHEVFAGFRYRRVLLPTLERLDVVERGLSAAALAQQVKGASSRVANQRSGGSFRWQGGYGAFSVSATDVPAVEAYVRGQAAHHADATTHPDWE